MEEIYIWKGRGGDIYTKRTYTQGGYIYGENVLKRGNNGGVCAMVSSRPS